MAKKCKNIRCGRKLVGPGEYFVIIYKASYDGPAAEEWKGFEVLPADGYGPKYKAAHNRFYEISHDPRVTSAVWFRGTMMGGYDT